MSNPTWKICPSCTIGQSAHGMNHCGYCNAPEPEPYFYTYPAPAPATSRPSPVRDRQPPAYTHPDALVHQIEETIRLAAKLGDDAFDLIEGRGLHAMRLQIEKDVASLRASRATLGDADLAALIALVPKFRENPMYKGHHDEFREIVARLASI